MSDKQISSFDKDDIPSNNSDNKPFNEVLQANISRRSLVTGSLTMAAASFFVPAGQAQGLTENENELEQANSPRRPLINFEPIPNTVGEIDNREPEISPDYEYQVLIPWGTPIEPGVTEEYTGDPSTRPTPEQAALQIGIGHDGMWFFPEDVRMRRFAKQGFQMSNRKGMLAINHEFGRNSHVLGKDAPESLQDVRLMQNVHGVSVVAIEKRRDQWEVVSSPNSRRITVNSRVDFSGPAAGSELLQNPAGNVALGTVNNCGSGPTPWGTYLTCEENFNLYFGATEGEGFNDRLTEEQERYGFDFDGANYGWEFFDKRFDLSDPDFINESHRFGWIVEIDPFDGTKKPVKRTALGRFKHEAIAIAESASGRIAAYMGDDQRFDYIYKFVSDKPWQEAIDAGESPLDEGKLFVARFDEDGTGEWLELTIENPVLAARFADQAEVLVFARIAADLLGATPMDRPEWTTIGNDGFVFCTLTNNSERTEPNAANPLAPNPNGHIIRWKDSEDFLGTSFEWDIFIVADTVQGSEQTFGSPDAAFADEFGRLFIGTDGGQEFGIEDQLIVFDTRTGESRRLYTGVTSDEVTGFTITPNQRNAFINMQHPGNGDPTRTNFPAAQDNVTIPRDCTIVITRRDGGIIGS